MLREQIHAVEKLCFYNLLLSAPLWFADALQEAAGWVFSFPWGRWCDVAWPRTPLLALTPQYPSQPALLCQAPAPRLACPLSSWATAAIPLLALWPMSQQLGQGCKSDGFSFKKEPLQRGLEVSQLAVGTPRCDVASAEQRGQS